MNYQYKGRYQNIPMPIGCLYLNNSGSRWVRQDMRFCLQVKGQPPKIRRADCFESFGNFALIVYRYKSKQYKKFADNQCKYSAIPIVITDHIN